MKILRPNRIIKVLALILVLMLLASCGNSGNTDITTTTTQPTTRPSEPVVITPDFRVGYIGSDSLNPYTASTAPNCAITRLMFDSLFVCDDSFEPQAVLAESYTYDGYIITVSLKQGVTFSDGTPLTTADVSYSFTMAKQSSVYSDRLASVAYTVYVDDYTVNFVMNKENPYAVSCLDFPIIKANTYSAPVGSGRYTHNTTYGSYLMRNDTYSLGENDGFGVIELCDVGTADTVAYKVQMGDIDFAFDNLSSGVAPSINTSNAPVSLNNMVFLGMNGESDLLQYESIRKAVRAGLDVDALAADVYGAFAHSSSLPYHPDWYAADADYTFEQKTTLEYLSAIGYNQINSDGLATNGLYTITLTLIVNEENALRVKLANQVASSLIAAGINVNVVKYSFNEYISALKAKNYDLYIGEVRLTADMRLSAILGGHTYYQKTNDYGVASTDAAVAAYTQFLTGELELNEFLDTFMASCPFAPICFRSGAVIFSRRLGGTGSVIAGDVFAGIDGWTMA